MTATDATSESYVTACVRAAGQDVVVRGRYLDTWSCRAGVWRIDDRHYENDVTQVCPPTTRSGSERSQKRHLPEAA